MALTPYEKQKRWREKHRALYNLQQRNRRKKNLGLVIEEPTIGATVPRIEMESQENFPVTKDESSGAIAGVAPKSGTFTTKKVGKFRMVVLPEEKPDTGVPVNVETRSEKDVVGGIYRNDNGGVISKFAWEKLQKMKAHAKENNFEIDEYSQ